MPNQKLMIGAGIVIIAILAIGGYFMFGKSQKAPETPTATETKPAEESQLKGSIKSLLGSGKNQTCTISFPDQGGTGTVYVSGKNVRGDFSTTIEAKVIESHIIQDGTYLYTWSTASPQGVKFKIDEVTLPSPSPAAGQVDLDREVDLKCSTWSVDNSKFTPPADVTFTDLTQTLKSVPQQGGGQKPSSSSCDQITDPQAKAACLQYSQ